MRCSYRLAPFFFLWPSFLFSSSRSRLKKGSLFYFLRKLFALCVLVALLRSPSLSLSLSVPLHFRMTSSSPSAYCNGTGGCGSSTSGAGSGCAAAPAAAADEPSMGLSKPKTCARCPNPSDVPTSSFGSAALCSSCLREALKSRVGREAVDLGIKSQRVVVAWSGGKEFER